MIRVLKFSLNVIQEQVAAHDLPNKWSWSTQGHIYVEPKRRPFRILLGYFKYLYIVLGNPKLMACQEKMSGDRRPFSEGVESLTICLPNTAHTLPQEEMFWALVAAPRLMSGGKAVECCTGNATA